MSPEPKTSDARAVHLRNAELILNRLSDYLSLRFDLACRINPQLKSIKQDLMYHELTNVRRSLLGDKIYGPVRLGVTDVFMGDDEKKRRGLMSASDQTSIQVELVSHCQDSKVESTRGQIRFHDLKSFYSAIDPNLTDLIDLVETWIWWDLLDAAEIVRFEQKMSLIQGARLGRLTDEIRKRYVMLIHPAGGEEDRNQQQAITDDDIIRYEFKQLMHIREQWVYRRGNERGFMYALKRDELPTRNQGEMIHKIAERVREYDMADALDELTDEIRHRFAPDLRLPPDKVTKKDVLEYLQNLLVQSEREMIHNTDRETQLGPPYNYKERQLEQMDKVMADLANQIRPILQPPAAPAKTAAAPPPPSAMMGA